MRYSFRVEGHIYFGFYQYPDCGGNNEYAYFEYGYLSLIAKFTLLLIGRM